MNKTLLYNVFGLIAFLFPTLEGLDLNAQIISGNSDAVKIVPYDYPTDSSVAPVFIFYSNPGETVFGNLTASLYPDSLYNFDWLMYNIETDTFDLLVKTQSGVTQSAVNNLGNGGYMVHIFNDTGTDTALIAWICIDKIRVKVDKDENEKLKQSAFTCDFLNLTGEVTTDTFYYYDPITKVRVRLKNDFTFLWTSDNSELTIFHPGSYLDPQNIDNPPYLDTWFILTATDGFGMSDVDSVFYESIQVKPQFRFRKYDPKEEKDFVDATPPAEGDAPLKIKFNNESVNGFSYEWIFSSDSARSGFFANEFTSDSLYQPEYIYKIPNDYGYYPELVATSAEGCVDTFRFEVPDPNKPPIKVLPSDLEVPNVFSPDGNGTNDFFKVKFKSMREFSLRIYDRAGKLVYKTEVSDMYSWEGWNGKVLDSNRDASAGAYFWVIQATGWDRKAFPKETRRGVVYLFREAQ